MESWLNTLNVLDSPTEVSPTTGPNDLYRSADSLSHPISSQDLFDQLQQWTNVDFNFNEPQQPATSVPSTNLESTSAHPYSGMFDSAQNRLGSIKGKSYEKGFSAPATSTFIDPNAVFAPQVDPVLFGNDLSLPTTSSFQYPALYPNFPAFEQQPIPAEPAPAPINPELTSSKATKSKAPKKGKKTTPAAVEKEKSAASTPVATTSPEGEEGQVPEVDDKRRRNTLASARFRVKKKEREQAMAKNAKELQDKVAVLEKEVDLLKKENGWLRGLIVEKAKPSTSASVEEQSSKRQRLE